MFHFISWQLFLTALTLLVVAYYLITSPLLYYKEITQRVKSLFNPSTPPVSEKEFDGKLHDNLIGNANETSTAPRTVNTSETSPEDFITTGSEYESDYFNEEALPNDLLIGSVADLLQEIKKLLQVIADDRTGKSESKALFNALLIRYPHLHNTAYSQAINFYLLHEEKDKFSFELTSDDLQSWWTPTADSAND